MIGPLFYSTTSNYDLMIVMCFCALFQLSLKKSHLSAFKCILRYLSETPKMGLWYPKEWTVTWLRTTTLILLRANQIGKVSAIYVTYLETHLSHGITRNKPVLHYQHLRHYMLIRVVIALALF